MQLSNRFPERRWDNEPNLQYLSSIILLLSASQNFVNQFKLQNNFHNELFYAERLNGWLDAPSSSSIAKSSCQATSTINLSGHPSQRQSHSPHTHPPLPWLPRVLMSHPISNGAAFHSATNFVTMRFYGIFSAARTIGKAEIEIHYFSPVNSPLPPHPRNSGLLRPVHHHPIMEGFSGIYLWNALRPALVGCGYAHDRQNDNNSTTVDFQINNSFVQYI